MSTLRRRASYGTIGIVWTAAAVAGGAAGFVQSLGPAPLGQNLEVSPTVLDRDGDLLRGYLTSEGRWRLPATRADVDPRFLEALLAYEDKRFFAHRGVALSIKRASFSKGQYVFPPCDVWYTWRSTRTGP